MDMSSAYLNAFYSVNNCHIILNPGSWVMTCHKVACVHCCGCRQGEARCSGGGVKDIAGESLPSWAVDRCTAVLHCHKLIDWVLDFEPLHSGTSMPQSHGLGPVPHWSTLLLQTHRLCPGFRLPYSNISIPQYIATSLGIGPPHGSTLMSHTHRLGPGFWTATHRDLNATISWTGSCATQQFFIATNSQTVSVFWDRLTAVPHGPGYWTAARKYFYAINSKTLSLA